MTERDFVPESPIFVCGTGRSGTSIIQHILSKHPMIYSLRYESRFLVSKDGLFDVLKDQDREEALFRFRDRILGDWYRKVYREGTEREYVGGLCTDLDYEHIVDLVEWLQDALAHADSRPEEFRLVRRFVEGMFLPGMTKEGKNRFLEKTPSNLLYMPELLAVFPEARFVHMVRDGRDVAASILANDFWPINPGRLMETTNNLPKTIRNSAIFWREFLSYGRDVGRQLPPGTYMEVRLEDLVADPERTLDEIAEHVGVQPEPRLSRLVDPERAHVGRWRQAFSEEDLQVFESEAGDLLMEFGYPLGPGDSVNLDRRRNG